jgi:hypothetical protein
MTELNAPPPEPISDETLTMIRRTWDGVDSTASQISVTNSSTPGQLLHALSCAPRDVRRLLAEVDRLRSELAKRCDFEDCEKFREWLSGEKAEADKRARGAELERDHFAEQFKQFRDLTRDEDGNVLPPESELPVGVFYGVLYGEVAS